MGISATNLTAIPKNTGEDSRNQVYSGLIRFSEGKEKRILHGRWGWLSKVLEFVEKLLLCSKSQWCVCVSVCLSVSLHFQRQPFLCLENFYWKCFLLLPRTVFTGLSRTTDPETAAVAGFDFWEQGRIFTVLSTCLHQHQQPLHIVLYCCNKILLNGLKLCRTPFVDCFSPIISTFFFV